MDLKEISQQMHSRFDSIESKVDRLDTKIDPYASRLSSLETNIGWLKGHLNLTSALLVSVGSGVLIWLLTK